MQERGDKVERVEGAGGSDMPPNEGKQGLLARAIPIVLSLVLAFFMVSFYFMPQLVLKDNYTTDTTNIVNDIVGLKTSVATLSGLTAQITNLSTNIGSVSSELAGLRGSIAGYATQGSVSALQTSIATIQADINSVKTSVADIPALKTQVTALQTSLDALKAQVTALDARVVKLETKTTTTTTSGGGVTTGDITVVSSILDEGTLVSTDNSTQSQIKLVITNTTSTDLEDIIISVLAIIDDSSSIKPTLGVSGWGSWSIKSWESGDLEIRSKVGYILKAGEKKNVYLSLTSWGDIVNTITGEREITYTDVSGSDIEVRSYSVK